MSKKNFISEYLSNESLDRIAKEIGEIEKKTSGEIRLSIKKKRGLLQFNSSVRDIALKEFFKLKMNNTRDKTGVLVLIIFDEHKFEIVADEGINSKISSEQWNKISNNISRYFSNKNFLEGILFGLDKIGEVLIKEFPSKSDDKNELSDEIRIEN